MTAERQNGRTARTVGVTPATSASRRTSERQLSDWVWGLAQLLGWRGYHTFDSRRSAPGFPDWVFVRGTRLLFVELKGDGGRTTAAQDAWLDELGAVPCVEAYLWSPADWHSGVIEELLRQPERRKAA